MQPGDARGRELTQCTAGGDGAAARGKGTMLCSETGVSKVKQQKIKELTWSAREASDVCVCKKRGVGTGAACRAQGRQRSMLRCRHGRGMRPGEGDNEHATCRGVDAREVTQGEWEWHRRGREMTVSKRKTTETKKRELKIGRAHV